MYSIYRLTVSSLDLCCRSWVVCYCHSVTQMDTTMKQIIMTTQQQQPKISANNTISPKIYPTTQQGQNKTTALKSCLINNIRTNSFSFNASIKKILQFWNALMCNIPKILLYFLNKNMASLPSSPILIFPGYLCTTRNAVVLWPDTFVL